MAFALCTPVCLAAPGDTQQETKDEHSLHFGVHLPRQRDLSRSLKVAKDLLAEGRYAESLPVIIRVLNSGEDAFDLAPQAQQQKPQSLHQEATRIIYELRPDGLEAYQLEVNARSRRELAKAGSDVVALQTVAASFPRTEAGRTACWLLAQVAMDKGVHEYAMGLLLRLGEDPDLGENEHAAIHAQLVLAMVSSGRTGDAVAVCRDDPRVVPLLQRYLHSGVSGALTAEECVRLIAQQTLQSERHTAFAQEQWLNSGGGVRRNPFAQAGVPHLWAKWHSHLPISTNLPSRVSSEAKIHENLLLASPLVVGKWIVARTTDGLAAYDRESGKLCWVSKLSNNRPSSRAYPLTRRERLLVRNPAIFRRAVGDSAAEGVSPRISSDGRHVFALDRAKLKAEAPEDDFWRLRSRYAMAGFTMNQVVAFDTATEGKLAWRSSNQEGLSGVYFLDCPLAVGSHLFVMGESDQSIYLYQLDAATGALRWKQQLASVESPITEDPARRFTGGSLCYADGSVLCSTGTGLVVAIDAVRLSLDWVYRFPVENSARVTRNSPWGRRHVWGEPLENIAKQWVKSQMLVSGKRVFVGAPESRLLHCVDLETGEPLWATKCGQPQLLCYASDQSVLVTTKDSLLILGTSTGDTTKKFAFSPGAPAGRGMAFGDQYLQPLAGGTIVAVDIHGKDEPQNFRVGPDEQVGNLAFAGGSLYALSKQGLACFNLPQSLQDVDNTLLEAQRNSIGGNTRKAIAGLLASHSKGTAHPDRELMLRELMSGKLDATRVDRQELAILDSLYTDRPIPVELRVARLMAARDSGDQDRLAGEIAAYCRTQGDQRLHLLSADLAMSVTHLFRTVAHESLALDRREALLRNLTKLAGPNQQSLVRCVLAGRRRGLAQREAVPTSFNPHWANRQVRVRRLTRPERIVSRRSGRKEAKEQAAPLSPQSESSWSGLQLLCSAQGNLLGINPFGEETFRVEPTHQSFDRLAALIKQKTTVAVGYDDRLFLSTGEDAVAFDPREDSSEPVWAARENLLRIGVTARTDEAVSLAKHIRTGVTAEVRLVGVSAEGVLVVGSDLLAYLDRDTGGVNWVRTGIRTGRTPTFDQEFVYSAPIVRPGWKVRIATGESTELSTPSGITIAAFGRLETLLHRKRDKTIVAVHDRVTEQIILEQQYDGTLQHTLLDGLTVLASNAGQIDVIDAVSGKRLLRSQVKPIDTLASVTALRLGDRLYVGLNQKKQHVHRAAGVAPVDGNPVLTGPLYCFDLSSGEKLWPEPVLLSGKAILQRHPAGCPVVVLAARVTEQQSSRRKDEIALLVLDGTTGRTLYADWSPRNSQARDYRIRFSHGPPAKVVVAIDDNYVLLEATDSPAPPGPPHTAKTEENAGQSLWSIGDAFGRLLSGGLSEKPPEPSERDSDDD